MAKKVTVQSVVREVMGPGFWEKGISVCYNDSSHRLKARKTDRRYKFMDVNVTSYEGMHSKLKKAIKEAITDRPGFVCTHVGIYNTQVLVYTTEDLQMPEPESAV